MSNAEMVNYPTGREPQVAGGALELSGLTIIGTDSGLVAAALLPLEMEAGFNDIARTFGHYLLVASVAIATGTLVVERHTYQRNEYMDGEVSEPYACSMRVCAATERTADGAAHLSGTQMRAVPGHELPAFWDGFKGSDEEGWWKQLRDAPRDCDVFWDQNTGLWPIALGVAACHTLYGRPAREAFEELAKWRLELAKKGTAPPSITGTAPPAITA